MDEHFELVRLASGIHSVRSIENGQTFHPVIGPAAEARDVHVLGSRIVERARLLAPLVIWDVGLGAAANALAATEALSSGTGGDVLMLSFDRDLRALEFALANAEALGSSRAQAGWMSELRERGSVTVPIGPFRLEWRFCGGDFPSLLAGAVELPSPHAVFFDPYSPAVNPEMWTLGLFSALRARLRPEAPCLLTTYTRSTAVRVTLLLAGFHAGLGPATGEKDQTTVASNDPASLLAPLDRRWLERVQASTNAAPLRDAFYARSPISDEDFARLRDHPQFASRYSGPL